MMVPAFIGEQRDADAFTTFRCVVPHVDEFPVESCSAWFTLWT